jgi:uncharacterized membrane protein
VTPGRPRPAAPLPSGSSSPASAWWSAGLGAAAFLILVSAPALAGILAFLAAAAIVDIVVVTRRKLRGEPG